MCFHNINYNPNKRKKSWEKAYDGSKSQDPTPNQTPNATPVNSPQKRSAPPQADSPSEKTKNEHRRINYNPIKRKKAYNGSKSRNPTPNQTPNATPTNSPQKRSAPPQADSPSGKTKNVICNKCKSVRIDVCWKSPQRQRNCAAIGKVCKNR